MSIKNFFKWIALGLSILFFNPLLAQKEGVVKLNPRRDMLHIYFSSRNYVPLKIYNYGMPLLESSFTHTIGVGIGYTRLLQNNWGLQLNLEGANPRYKFSKYREPENIFPSLFPDYFDFTETKSISIGLHISVFKDFYLPSNFYVRLQGGFGLDYLRHANFEYFRNTDNENTYLFTLEAFRYPRNHLVKPVYFSKIGVGKNFNNTHFFTLSFVAHHAPGFSVFGKYAFFNPTEIVSNGHIKFAHSFLGLELSYNYALRKTNQILSIDKEVKKVQKNARKHQN